ncbi:hypothetical protein ACFX2A_013859 [Malus domestica]
MRDFSFIWSPGPPSLLLFPVTLLSSWTITLSNSPGPHLSRTTLILLQNPKNWRFHGTETKLKSPSFSVPPSSLFSPPSEPCNITIAAEPPSPASSSISRLGEVHLLLEVHVKVSLIRNLVEHLELALTEVFRFDVMAYKLFSVSRSF